MCLLSVVTSRAASDTIPDVLSAIVETHSGLWQISELGYTNPAFNQLRMPMGVTQVQGSMLRRSDTDNPDPRTGSGFNFFDISATTYTKYRTSTLWGNATYRKGKTKDVKWNETAHSDLVYPYVLADSVGGDMNQEIYRFSGGYADRRGKWGWGVRLGYEATLQFRSVDPRPRNITGNLEAAAGVMYRLLPGYYLGIGIEAMKYKQTNEIQFKNEMGVDKVYHLTGLGNHYYRFAGTGLSTYYDGHRYGAQVNLYPSHGGGVFASCGVSRFEFSNIISDLNKLPMAKARHTLLQAQGGWSGRRGQNFGGASAQIAVYRRHGTENIFGDAASSIFPLTGSNEMFADNAVDVSLKFRIGRNFARTGGLQLTASPCWGHRTTAYVEPYSYKQLNHIGGNAEIYGDLRRGDWLLEASFATGFRCPYKCDMSIVRTSDELNGLHEAEQGEFLLESSRRTQINARLGITRRAGRYAGGISAEWAHSRYDASLKSNLININITLSF